MIFKKEVFIVMITAVFVIGLLTILSFDGGTRKSNGLPAKWKDVGIKNIKIDTTNLNNNKNSDDGNKWSNKPITDKPITDKPITDKPITDKPITNKPTTNKPTTNKPTTNKPTTNKPTTTTTTTTNKPINNKSKDHRLPRWSKEQDNPFNKIDSSYKKNEKKNIERAKKVKEAMKFAWDSYRDNAWGRDEWLPTTKQSSDWLGSLGLTIVDSLDTLQVMGLEKELAEGREWVEKLVHRKPDVGTTSVFESNIRYLGTYLSMYDLTGDELYKEKARDFGDILMHSFVDGSPFPTSYLDFKTFETRIPSWTGSCVILSELGTMSLEFTRLTDITGDPKYKQKTDGIIKALMKLNPSLKGLYPVFISPDGSRFCNNQISIGAMGDSYYEYLLKMWIYRDGQDDIDYQQLFEEAADSIIEHLYKVSAGGDGYISTYEYGRTSNKQEHLTCFAGGMFALAAASNITGDKKKNKVYMDVGVDITNTCAKTYLESPTGLGAEIFVFEDSGTIRQKGAGTTTWYLLRPETVESIFILWRLTGDEKYQEWGWKIFESIEKYCRLENGYAGLKDVNVVSPKVQDSVQQSFFMSETLKYLYLLFKDSNTIPLDKYVFNTECHPFLIQY